MVIYLDLVIISTLLVNTLIIEGIESIFKERVRIWRVIISGILSVLLLGLYLLPIAKFAWIRYLMGIPIAVVAFPKGKITKKIIQIVFYYLLHLALVGTLAVFKIRSIIFILITTILVVVLGILTSFRNHYELEVMINKKGYKALYDSGNLSYYLGKPIIYLDNRFKTNIYQKIDICEISNVGGKSMVDIYTGPKLNVNRKDNEVYYAFIDIDEYDVILHKDIGGIRCLNC